MEVELHIGIREKEKKRQSPWATVLLLTSYAESVTYFS